MGGRQGGQDEALTGSGAPGQLEASQLGWRDLRGPRPSRSGARTGSHQAWRLAFKTLALQGPVPLRRAESGHSFGERPHYILHLLGYCHGRGHALPCS